MGAFLASVQLWITWGCLYAASIIITIEPKQTVWVMACFGSFGAALYGPPRGIWRLLGYWVVGVFFSISFVIGFDHFQPEAEAFFTGLCSCGGVKFVMERFLPWISGVSFPGFGGSGNAR